MNTISIRRDGYRKPAAGTVAPFAGWMESPDLGRAVTAKTHNHGWPLAPEDGTSG